MQPPKIINKMPVLMWADLGCYAIPWGQFPVDVVDRWKQISCAAICLMDYSYEESLEYWFLMCDKEWNVVASDFSYSLESAKESLAKEIKVEVVNWIDER
jgi:hypothetical protein